MKRALGQSGSRAVVLACALVGLAGGSAYGQSEEEPIFGRREQYKIISLEPPRLRAEMTGQFTRNTVSGTSGKTESRDWLFRETVSADTRGFIIHPNLVDLSLAGTFGLSQDYFTSSETGSEDSRGIIYGFDLSATILRKEIAPLTLYAQRYETQLSRDFGPTLTNLVTTFGGTWRINWPTLPTTFQAFHTEQVLTDPLGEQGFRQTQDAFLWDTEWRIGANHALSWNYSYNHVVNDSELGERSEFDTHDMNLSHSIGFGSRAQYSLISTVGYLSQSGTFPLDRFRWTENLSLRHSDVFDTFLTYEFQRDSIDFLDQSHHRGLAGFHHQLYKSLRSTGRVGLDVLDTAGDQRTTEKFADLTLDYTKKVPLGTLTALVGGGYSVRDAESQTGPVQVLDQAFTFTDPSPIIIPRNNVVADSIVLTDPTGLRVFSPISDYRVIVLPTRVEIRRLLGGAIGPGQAVLVDYLLEPQPANIATTTSLSFGARYSIEEGPLKGLSVYGRYLIQNQDIESEVSQAFIPDNIRDLVVGAEYRFWALVLSAEWEKRFSEISPFEAMRFNARYAQRVWADTTLGATASYEQDYFPDEDNRVRFLQFSASAAQDIGRNLTATLTAAWRDERNELFGNTRGFEQQLEVNWRYRQTTVFARLRNATLDLENESRTFQFAYVGIQREF
jgi:hypothetical protein